MSGQFLFNLGDKVALEMSQEQGRVIGRAEYADHPPSYFVRYVAADGRQVQEWFDGAALEAV